MARQVEFEVFWQHYPRRVGKLAAAKAYEKARRLASAEDIVAGIERYKRTKPAYADWCHPATYLNQGRWMDEPDPARAPRLCPHTPRCDAPGGSACTMLTRIAEFKRAGTG